MNTTTRTTLIFVCTVTFISLYCPIASALEPIRLPLVDFVDPTPDPIADAFITFQRTPEAETSPSDLLQPRETSPPDLLRPDETSPSDLLSPSYPTKNKTTCPKCRQRWKCCCGGIDYMIIGRGGGNYYRLPSESQMGGSYGIEAAVTLHNEWGLVGNLNVNHERRGEQIMGSLGIAKLPDHNGGRWLDQFSMSFFFDQFTDTRIDTFQNSLYLGQVRFQLGYSPRPNFEIGMLYSEPIIRDNDVQFVFINFPASAPMAGRVDMGRNISGYVSGRIRCLQWSLMAGYREDPRTFAISCNLRRRITERVSVYTGGSFSSAQEGIGAFFGMEFAFGPSIRRSLGGDSVAYNYSGDDGLVRAQSPDSVYSFVNIPGDTPGPGPNENILDVPFDQLNTTRPPTSSSPGNVMFARDWRFSEHEIAAFAETLSAMAALERNSNGFLDLTQRFTQIAAGELAERGVDGRPIGRSAQQHH